MFKIKIFPVSILFLICSSCTNNSKKSETHLDTKSNSKKEIIHNSINDSIRNYKKLLAEGINRSKKNNIDTEFIKLILPLDQEEYEQFYALTYNENTVSTFEKINLLIETYSVNDEVFLRYLNLAEFVDGEYAESYFEDIEVIIHRNKAKFCNLLNKISTGAMFRLDEYKNVCK